MWLDRDLIVGPYLALALTEQEFHKALKHCKVDRSDWGPWISANSDATCHTMTNAGGGLVCVVCIRPKPDSTAVQIAAILVHEAVHVWQQWRSRVGEREPSIEFEAYSIQAISQRLMQSYADRVK